MDPVTHALLGSAAARLALARPLGRAAWLPGVAGALLPDADAAIRSASDPLLYAEFHRHFTHSLTFIPIGGALAALPWILRRATRPQWKAYFGAALVGCATHGPLDASTTWGTSLLWPFSDVRVAWSWIAIVDPLFTTLLVIGVGLGVRRRSITPLACALLLCAAYLAAGAAQHARALDVQARLAAVRGHGPVDAAVFPGFGNTVIWRSLYRSGGMLHMDRIRVPPFGEPGWSPGTSVAAFEAPAAAPGTAVQREHARSLQRFQRFTSGWTAGAPAEPDVIGDARYSMTPQTYEPVWGIRLLDTGPPFVEWIDRSSRRRVDVRQLLREVWGLDERYRPISGRGE